MPYLADTNVAARLILPTDPRHADALAAITALRQQGETVFITSQVLVEFHALATRPIAANGLGWTAAYASLEARQIEALFPMLTETFAIYPVGVRWSINMELLAVRFTIRDWSLLC